MNRKFFILISALMLLAGPVKAQGNSNIETLGQSGAIVSSGARVRSASYINLKAGQESAPLTMYYQNGSDKTPGFTNFYLAIAGTKILDQNAFKKDKLLKQDMSGTIQSGDSQVLFMGDGPKGATFSWTLTAAKPKISLLEPDKAKVGDKVTIKGHFFNAKKSGNHIDFEGETSSQILNANPDAIECTVPSGLKVGDNKVTVSCNGFRSNAVTIKITAGEPPLLEGVSLESAFSGLPVTITGKNFSKDMSKNVVKFGSLVAPIQSGNETSLTVLIPQMDSPQWYVPITVTSDGLKSTNSLSINIQRRVF